MSTLPSYDDLPEGTSWHVWPGNEVYGTLNLLTPERAVAGAALVQTGETFPLNWNMELPGPPLFGREAFQHQVNTGSSSRDDVLQNWNTQSSSQWDGFRHVFHPTLGNYGGIGDEGHGMHFWARKGIVGRGVLADVARWRADQGRPLDPSSPDAIEPSDLDGCLAAQGVTLEVGDVLLVHTGWMRWYVELDDNARATLVSELATPGLRPGRATAAWLWDNHVAAVAADNPAVEVWPAGALLSPEDRATVRDRPDAIGEFFGHFHFLPMLGIPLGEMFNLPALADACAADGRYDFMFTSAPLNLLHGVASPPNALAIR
ncbi:MAG: cyclase family protein [Actinobacteria bacterium]|nr:cyclase family protein [Actinomycetota bacterium]